MNDDRIEVSVNEEIESYSFDDFTVIPSSRSLIRGESVVNIKQKELDILLFLIEKAGKKVTIDDLLNHVWGGIIIEDKNVSRQVNNLRKTLCSFDNKKYIAKISNGWQFISKVKINFKNTANKKRDIDVSNFKSFKEFFGDSIFERSVKLVFAYRQSLDDDNLIVPSFELPPQSKGKKALPEGVDFWIPSQDIRAAVYVSNLIFSFTRKGFKFVEDTIATDEKNCMFSFGLGFNKYTETLLSLFNSQEFVEIYLDNSPRQKDLYTDNFKIGGVLPAEIDEQNDVAFVARIVTKGNQIGEYRVRFICAGRTALGTAVAGFYLANNWEKIHNLYTEHKKNLKVYSLVIGIGHTYGEKLLPDYDKTGEILKKDGKDLIRFSKVKGMEED
ncbi:MAG: winged helix-turn-helix domain-containing protein [Pyrinomonadaceae bacterium]|jgi:DNA-binding winged helix-turn-helix (wHTH) protein|nr:winged helix-turn-helix domain-containing protein [Pyrinomonadaceae bacterium]